MTNPTSISRSALIAFILALGAALSACGTGTSTETDEAGLTEEEAASTETAVATPVPVAEPSKPVKAAAAPAPTCADCGTISNIEQKTEKGKASGGGAVAGAIIGGAAGREIVKGDRSKRNLAGVAGAIAGGYAGHKIEEKARSSTYYVVSVRMDDGRTETVTLNSVEGLSLGQKVRVDGENIILR